MDISLIELQKALSGAEYPADKQGLLDLARDNGASEEVVDALEHIEDADYDGPDSVGAAVSRAD